MKKNEKKLHESAVMETKTDGKVAPAKVATKVESVTDKQLTTSDVLEFARANYEKDLQQAQKDLFAKYTDVILEGIAKTENSAIIEQARKESQNFTRVWSSSYSEKYDKNHTQTYGGVTYYQRPVNSFSDLIAAINSGLRVGKLQYASNKKDAKTQISEARKIWQKDVEKAIDLAKMGATFENLKQFTRVLTDDEIKDILKANKPTK